MHNSLFINMKDAAIQDDSDMAMQLMSDLVENGRCPSERFRILQFEGFGSIAFQYIPGVLCHHTDAFYQLTRRSQKTVADCFDIENQCRKKIMSGEWLEELKVQEANNANHESQA